MPRSGRNAWYSCMLVDPKLSRSTYGRPNPGRRRAKRVAPRLVVETKIDFDDEASSSSTLLQVVAQDVSGLLRAISATLSELDYNVEVALIDTEGETAIDVFYLTSDGQQLSEAQKKDLREALAEAIEANAK